ncbi:hypothetical protein [Methylobacterium symbioticum]|uniref:Uncharacterized protein n=1 Tax=Methylobacterium symbioticum TaxID=2584084 RepID=A0A509EB13_9HYPH|nr:hypothetical protein [Methylobacterium symbioticum]VUD71350.1 hypothetical protein MET9862_01929 [Methylobacterium symbioticum]
MELILILAAILACIVAGVAVIAISARHGRPPLRLGNEHDERDEALLLAEVGPSHSPIDRDAEILEAEVLELDQARDAPRLPREPKRER